MQSKFVSSFLDRKVLYIIQCSYQALRYSIVYINENRQAAIICNNIARYLDIGSVASKDYIFPWLSARSSQYKYEWNFAKQFKLRQWVTQL